MGAISSYTLIRDPLMRLCHWLMAFSIAGRSQALEKVTSIDLFYLRSIDVGSVNIPYLLAQYLRRYDSGRKQGARMSDGEYVAAVGVAQVEQEMYEEGVQADKEPLQASPAAAPAARTMPQRMGTLEEEVHGLHESLGEKRAVLDEMSRYFSRFMMWVLLRLLQEVLQLPM
ncbi:hypothetical protein Tco_0615756 [Tanacetum coccineum]